MPRRKSENSAPSKKAKPQARPKPERREGGEDRIARDIADDFAERQKLSEEGRRKTAERLEVHNALSPEISAGDIDAAWELGRASGEETFTGHAPTPDQDVVDDLGQAAGLTYRDDEPLNYGKINLRDQHRWELDARSGAEEQELETEDEDDDLEEELDEDDDEDAEGLLMPDLADDLDEDEDEAESEAELLDEEAEGEDVDVEDEELDDDLDDLDDEDLFDDEDEDED